MTIIYLTFKNMKKYKFYLIAILATILPQNSMAQSDNYEPYAVLSDSNTVLTFYYDDKKAIRNGMNIGPYTYYYKESTFYFQPAAWDKEAKNIMSVVFDASFADCTTITSTAFWFHNCKNLINIIGIKNLITTNVADMGYMFWGCSSLTNLDLSSFNTANVTSMARMFSDCGKLTSLDLSNFNTDKVTDMSNMFSGCTNLSSIELNKFNTAQVTDMAFMFYDCRNLTNLDLTNFNTAQVKDMHNMFQYCMNLTSLDLNSFNTAQVTDMAFMFYHCYKLESIDLNIDYFRTDNVTNMSGMFCCCRNLREIVGIFNTSNVTNMNGMFVECRSLSDLPIVTNFDTSNVTDMSGMFWRCSKLSSLDLSNFDTDKVLDMQNMFRECKNLSSIYVGSRWSTKSVIISNDMFSGCTSLSGEMGTKYDDTHTDCTYARFDRGSSSPGYFTRGTHIVNIIVSGSGYAIYDKKIRNSTFVFWPVDGTSVTIELVPDKGAVLKSLTVNGNDEISNISDNKFTMSISSYTIIKVVFDTIQTILNEGIEYNVVSANDETVNVAKSNHELWLNIPSSITAYGIDWTVIGIEKDAFKNYPELAAVIWNPEFKFTENVNNPNLLLYVKSEDYAPADINNVIVNGTARKITLTDAVGGNNFYCPQAFTATQITYEHNYSMKTGFNTCRGWESIALPFDVTHVNSSTGAELIPYSLWTYGNIQRPFWLYGLNENGWKSETAIKANTPYLISMPNNETYEASYNQSGKIVFSASDVEVKASDEITNSKYGQRIFVPNYQHQKSSSDIYALNVNNSIYTYTETDPVEGSAFIRELRNVGPFEAYMMIEGNVSATRSVSIFGDYETTGIMDLPMSSDYNGNNKVYSLSGRIIKQVKDDKDIQNIPKGVYIINGKKVIK